MNFFDLHKNFLVVEESECPHKPSDYQNVYACFEPELVEPVFIESITRQENFQVMIFRSSNNKLFIIKRKICFSKSNINPFEDPKSHKFLIDSITEYQVTKMLAAHPNITLPLNYKITKISNQNLLVTESICPYNGISFIKELPKIKSNYKLIKKILLQICSILQFMEHYCLSFSLIGIDNLYLDNDQNVMFFSINISDISFPYSSLETGSSGILSYLEGFSSPEIVKRFKFGNQKKCDLLNTSKCEVYSFGIFMLLLCGVINDFGLLKELDDHKISQDKHIFIEKLSGNLNINSANNNDCNAKLKFLIKCCIEFHDEKRINISDLFLMLTKIEKLSLSDFYNQLRNPKINKNNSRAELIQYINLLEKQIKGFTNDIQNLKELNQTNKNIIEEQECIIEKEKSINKKSFPLISKIISFFPNIDKNKIEDENYIMNQIKYLFLEKDDIIKQYSDKLDDLDSKLKAINAIYNKKSEDLLQNLNMLFYKYDMNIYVSSLEKIPEITEKLINCRNKGINIEEKVIQARLNILDHHQVKYDLKNAFLNANQIDLTHIRITKNDLNAISEVLMNDNSIISIVFKYFNFHLRKEIGSNPLVKEDDYSNLSLGLNNCTNLIEFRLSDGLTDLSITNISRSLKNNKKLRIIELGGVNISDKGASEISDCIKNKLKLEVFNFWGNKLTDHGVKKISLSILDKLRLNFLYIWGIKFGNKGINELMKAISNKINLKYLYLTGEEITDEGVSNIAKTIIQKKELKSIFLSGIFGDNGIHELAKSILSLPEVNFLHFRGRKITDSGASNLAKLILASKFLNYFYLFGESITDKGSKQILDAFGQRQIRYLNIVSPSMSQNVKKEYIPNEIGNEKKEAL